MTATRCFAYLRVSSKGQVEGDGFRRQRAAIEAYVRARCLRVDRWFEERGVSGAKDLEHRPALQEMLVAFLSNGIRTVLIEKLDRLARDLMIQETIISDFRKRGFDVISVEEPDLCSDDPSRKLVRQVFGAIAEYERAMIVLKLRAARQRVRAATGRCEGRKPYGERVGEDEMIRRIRQLSHDRLSLSAIARQLNDEGARARHGGKWFPMQVRNILRRG